MFEDRISGQDRYILQLTLGDQQAVERVTMMVWQRVDLKSVAYLDWQGLELV
jgi:hypothetical protein